MNGRKKNRATSSNMKIINNLNAYTKYVLNINVLKYQRANNGWALDSRCWNCIWLGQIPTDNILKAKRGKYVATLCRFTQIH